MADNLNAVDLSGGERASAKGVLRRPNLSLRRLAPELFSEGGVAILLLLGLVVLTTNILTPAIVGTHVEAFGLTIDQAGYAAAAYMAGGGFGGLVTGALLLRAPTKALLFVGLSGLVSSDSSSSCFFSFHPSFYFYCL
jgi:MFS family permease